MHPRTKKQLMTRLTSLWAIVLGALFFLGALTPAVAGPIGVAKAAGDVGLAFLEKPITKPAVLVTLFFLNPADQSIPVPINRQAQGLAGSAAQASNFFVKRTDQDPAPGQGDQPGFRVGPIYTPGNPPTTASVATRRVSASVMGAHADAQAQIAGSIIPGEEPGDTIGVNAITLTSANASAVFGIASSAASAGTNPFVFTPPEGTFAQVDIELNTGIAVSALASEGGSARGRFFTQFTSNLTDYPILFDLGIDVEHDSKTFSANIDFASSLPFSDRQRKAIFDSFVIDAASGSVSLVPTSTAPFSFRFGLPVGRELQFNSFTSSVVTAAVPEPSTLALVALALVGLLVGSRLTTHQFAPNHGFRTFRQGSCNGKSNS